MGILFPQKVQRANNVNQEYKGNNTYVRSQHSEKKNDLWIFSAKVGHWHIYIYIGISKQILEFDFYYSIDIKTTSIR